MQLTSIAMGLAPIELIYVDKCCEDRDFLESIFTPIRGTTSMPTLTVAKDKIKTVSMGSANSDLLPLLDLLSKSKTKIAGCFSKLHYRLAASAADHIIGCYKCTIHDQQSFKNNHSFLVSSYLMRSI